MSSMSRTSTITPEMASPDTQSRQSSIEILPIEVFSFTSNRTSSSTTEFENSSLDDLQWLFELVSSNITMISISSIITALVCHTLYSIRTGFQDICFNGTTSHLESRTSSSSFADESYGSGAELLQWAELLSPAIASTMQKTWDFVAFSLAPIAVSAALILSLQQVRGSKLGSFSELSSVVMERETGNRALPLESEAGFFWVAERPSGFMVQYNESCL